MQNQNQNQNQMLFPSHNAVVVVVHYPLHVSADTRSCATRRDICSFASASSTPSWSDAYLHSLAGSQDGWLAGRPLHLAGKEQRSEANEPNLRPRGAPANGGDEVGADSHDGRSPHHSLTVVNKFN